MLPIEEIVESLKRVAKLDPKTLIAVENDLEAKEAEIKAEKETEKGPKSKAQFVIILLDPENHVKGDVTGFVTQIPESEDAGTVLDRLHKASYAFNRSKKRGANVVNLGEIGSVKRRFLKDEGIHLKNREAVRVVVSQGPIPTV